ncbi:MAG: RNA polymerase factor sigma-54 [Thiobacillaceae bacterium]|jgi:RNA polymerase sigma-54 factor|nr:RNA polymerase factor sigma-54 [Thiobacillaceae bacterium]
MKQSLQLKLHQQLALTPQLQQSIRLLQLSSMELDQEIGQMLQDNPLLERAEEEYAADRGAQSAEPEHAQETPAQANGDDVYDEMAWGERSYAGASSDDDEDREFQQTDAASQGLRQHLLGQLSLTAMPERDRRLVALLIESLDDDGYLGIDLGELADMMPEEVELDPVELSAALKLLQSFDPVGVGARGLGECLWLQLNALPPDTPHLAQAMATVRDHLGLLAEREYGKLKKLLDVHSDKDFIAIRHLITSLDPRPGARYTPLDTRYVVPDVLVKKVKGLWTVSLNPDAMPKLRINQMYADILRHNREDGGGLSSQLQEARWLIKNVQQRFETILRVAQAIVDRQRHFLEYGEVAMRPLTLREIGDALDLHESTISRVTTQKFMLTPRGIYEFKYFFGSSLATETGGAASSTAIKALIKQFIEAENTARPLSDNTISDMLKEQGFVVARRTVAKYREMMNIPPANQRKSA